VSITIDTVGACLKYGYDIRGCCSCGHVAAVDLLAVSVAHGEGMSLDRLWSRLRCTKCRSRRVSIQLVPKCDELGLPERK
jgi:hypothetical protein